MNISAEAIRRPVTTVMAMVALVFIGMISYFRLGVELFPDVSFPIVVVSTTYQGASSQELETLVSKPIEEAVSSINGIEHVRSTSGQGISAVVVEFKLGTNVKESAVEVREKVDQIRQRLPAGTDPPIITRVSPDAAPIMTYAVGGDYPVERLTDLMRDVIKPRLEQINGVADINITGALEREVQITIDPVLLRKYGVGLATVANMLKAENFNLPSGQLTNRSSEITMRTTNAFTTASELETLPVTVLGGRQVTIGDLGTVIDGYKEQRAKSWLNGKPALAFSITKQSGTNTVQVGADVKKAVAKLQTQLPPGVTLAMAFDMTKFILDAKESSIDELLIGAVLAVIVIFAFMRVFRGTMIAAIAIPTSIIGTYTMMYMLGFTLNMMSLMALSLVVGVLVDDAVVDLENIFRFMEQGETPYNAAMKASDEIGLAVVATTFSIVPVFLPIGFMGGMVGQFFRQFGLTVSCAVLISLVVARTLTPMLAAYWLKPVPIKLEEADSWYAKAYVPALYWALTHRKSIIALAIGFFLISFPIIGLVPKGFVPKNDRDEFQVTVKMPPGSSMEKTTAMIQEIERRLHTVPLTKTTVATAGSVRSGIVDTGNVGVTCRSKSEGRKVSVFVIQNDVRKALGSLSGAKIAIQEFRAVDDGNGAYAVNLKLKGENLVELSYWADRVVSEMKKLPGVIDTDTSSSVAQREFHIELDQQKAAEAGVSASTIAYAMRLASQGDTPSKLRLPTKDVDIRVRLTDAARYDMATLENLSLTGSTGRPVSLGQVANLSYAMGPTRIERYDRTRQITVYAATVPGTSTGNVVYPLGEVMKTIGLPPSVTFKFEGEAERMQDSFKDLIMALVMAIVFIYLILASQFEHFLHPFTIMMSVPLAFSGAFFGLFIANEELGMMSMIGIVMLMGLVVKNAILLIDYTITLRNQGVPRFEALMKAGPVRLRPIMMTSIAMIAGMVPVAMRLTVGSEGRAPMAVAVIGGLVTSTLLTLVVVPVIYTLVDDGVLAMRRLMGKKPKGGGTASNGNGHGHAPNLPHTTGSLSEETV
ncbi:MAG: efflux RND transporter permease subunit [Candidatus Sericytochromatia bacterium]|nr:efflux RND transporter permease subunit [Candidatus Sericytochromatia bacterium]